MLGKTGAETFFNQIHDFYIQPELDRRKAEGKLADDFQIRECLIRLPKDGKPIVEFNNEFGWQIEHPELAPGLTMELGQPVYLHEVVNLGKVLPPTVEETRVAFVF